MRLRFAWTVAALTASVLQGCATRSGCGLVACGVQHDALLKVTATQLTASPADIQIYDIQSYPGATVAWRARRAGALYQCREARDPADATRVHFVYCRPAT